MEPMSGVEPLTYWHEFGIVNGCIAITTITISMIYT